MAFYQQDVLLLRQQLQVTLTDRFDAYYDKLRAFFKAKVSKHEFDQYVRTILPGKQLNLHNLFISAILTKSYANTPAPPVLLQRGGSKVKVSLKQRKRRHMDLSTMGSRLKQQYTDPMPRRWFSKAVRKSSLKNPGSQQIAEIRQRIVLTAEAAGLQGATPESAALVEAALHAHLMRLLMSCKLRLNAAADESEEREEDKAPSKKRRRVEVKKEEDEPQRSLVTPRVLHLAASRSPVHYLREDLTLNMEMLLSSLE